MQPYADYEVNDGTEEAQAYFADVEKQLSALDAEMAALNKVGEKHSDISPGDVLATATLSPEARGVYHHLLSEMGKGNKDVQKSARGAALLAARMTDRLVALHREAGDKDYTAMDALPELLANAGETAQEKEAAQLRQTVADRRLKEDVLAWKEKVNRFFEGTLPLRNNIVMRSPLVFDLITADNLPIVIDSRILQKIVNKHKFTRKELIQLPQKIANPLFILRAIDSKTGEEDKQKKIVVIDMEVNGATVMVPFVLNTTQGFNKIASAYGRTKRQVPNDDWYVQRLNNKNLLYINKKMTDRWVKSRTGLAGRHNAPLTIQSFAVNNIPNETDLGKLKRENRGYYQRAQVRTQKEAVRKQYEGTAMWMKAPNGKDTNLTEEQWLLVRTPAFKAWFGDWEYIANAYPSVTAKERGDVKAVIKALQGKVLRSEEEGVEATFSHRGLGKVTSDGAVQKSIRNGFSVAEHFTAVANVEKLFTNSIKTNDRANDNKELAAIEHFSSLLVLNNQPALVTFTIKVTNNAGRKIYSIELMEMEKAGGKVQGEIRKSRQATPAFDVLNISKIADKVNTASKVVDENGEPLVVYHGSDAEFDVFDRSKGRSSMDIQGMFFSPWKDDAQGYGKNVRAFFLNIKHPADDLQAYEAFAHYKGQNYAGIKAREELIANGYDGVNNDGEEYIAFEPTQIKSVDNNGNFDPEDANIYHQEAGGDTKNNLVLRQEKENTAENKESEEWFIDTFLREKLPEDKRAAIETKIRAGIEANFERMTPDNVTDIRDGMPILKALRSTYLNEGHLRLVTEDVEEARDELALWYGYAKRCFDNDGRTKRILTVRDGNSGQSRRIHRDSTQTDAERTNGRTGKGSRRNILVRENAEYSEIMTRFKNIIQVAQKHSENQGAFSNGILEQAA